MTAPSPSSVLLKLLAKLALWGALYTLALTVGAHSFFVVGPRGQFLIPVGLFAMEKKLLVGMLHFAFAGWVMGGLLHWDRFTSWFSKVALGVTIVFVPAIMLMSWPRLLLAVLPEGVRAPSETRMVRGAHRPRRLFLGDPVISRETRS